MALNCAVLKVLICSVLSRPSCCALIELICRVLRAARLAVEKTSTWSDVSALMAAVESALACPVVKAEITSLVKPVTCVDVSAPTSVVSRLAI